MLSGAGEGWASMCYDAVGHAGMRRHGVGGVWAVGGWEMAAKCACGLVVPGRAADVMAEAVRRSRGGARADLSLIGICHPPPRLADPRSLSCIDLHSCANLAFKVSSPRRLEVRVVVGHNAN